MEIKRIGRGIYGKEIILNNGIRALLSYRTIVAVFKDGKFYKTWDGWSATTLRSHVKYFWKSFSKKEWEEKTFFPLREILRDDDYHDIRYASIEHGQDGLMCSGYSRYF